MAYEDCRAVRPHCPHPLVLDECIDSLAALLAAQRDGVADGVTIKIARVGGVGPAALLRDVAVELALPVTVEDTGGSDIDTAAMAHLSLSTPEELRIHTVDFNAWVTVGNADGDAAAPPAGACARRTGRASASRSSWMRSASRSASGPSACRRRERRPPRARGRADRRGGAGEARDDERAHEIGVERRHDHAVAQHREPADQAAARAGSR